MGQLVVRVACGARHCGAVTAEGILLTWGGNDSGQLGHGDTAQLSRRRRVAALAREQVVLVACGRSHTLARTAGGAVDADTPLLEAGLDSLGAVELRNQLQQALDR